MFRDMSQGHVPGAWDPGTYIFSDDVLIREVLGPLKKTLHCGGWCAIIMVIEVVFFFLVVFTSETTLA